MTNILEVRDLAKHYKQVNAVNGIAFTVRQGICFGLPTYKARGKPTSETVKAFTRSSSVKILYHSKVLIGHFSPGATAPMSCITAGKSLLLPNSGLTSHSPTARLSQWHR